MNKEVIKRVYILICVFSLIFNINSTLYVNRNNINEIKPTNIEAHEIVKTKSVTHNVIDNKKIEEQKQIIKLKPVKIKTNKTLSRGGSIDYDTIFELTFYSGLVRENSKYGAVTHKGIKLFDGVVANNVLPYKTKIKLEGWGTVEVLDVGGNSFDSPYRLDVYVPKIKGESDDEYYNRVQRMGRIKVQGKIVN